MLNSEEVLVQNGDNHPAPKASSLADRSKPVEDRADGPEDGGEGGDGDVPERGAPHRQSIAG